MSSVNLDQLMQYSYQDSTEATKLFNPKYGESVQSCLTKCINTLADTSYNKTLLTHLVIDVTDINSISSYQQQMVWQ